MADDEFGDDGFGDDDDGFGEDDGEGWGDEDGDGGFEDFEEEEPAVDPNDWTIPVENSFYDGEGLMRDDPKGAMKHFQECVSVEEDKGDKMFKLRGRNILFSRNVLHSLTLSTHKTQITDVFLPLNTW